MSGFYLHILLKYSSVACTALGLHNELDNNICESSMAAHMPRFSMTYYASHNTRQPLNDPADTRHVSCRRWPRRTSNLCIHFSHPNNMLIVSIFALGLRDYCDTMNSKTHIGVRSNDMQLLRIRPILKTRKTNNKEQQRRLDKVQRNCCPFPAIKI